MADRYTYAPMIGICIIIVWSLKKFCGQIRWRKVCAGSVIGAALAASAAQTRVQLGYWKNDEVLFQHTLAVTQNNYLADNNLGTYLSKKGQIAEALSYFQKSIEINPADAKVYYNLGNQYTKLSDWDKAIGFYGRSLELQ